MVCNIKERANIYLSCDEITNIPCNLIFYNYHINLSSSDLCDTHEVSKYIYFYNCFLKRARNPKIVIHDAVVNSKKQPKGKKKIKNRRISKLKKPPASFMKNIFKKNLTFNECVFYDSLQIHQNQFLEHLVFINCYDKQNDIKITSLELQENKIKGYLFIKNCAIKNINLWKNKFENRSYFVDSEFGYEQDKDNKAKLNFSNTCFKDNAYFNNSKFYSYADFHECEFEKIACFYGVIFDKAPNFSQIILKDNFNALNITLNFTFDDLEKQIKQEHEYFNKDKNEKDKKSLDKFANDFRDSFRVFKNALIKDNNLLEASKFHKYELYCKEIELEEKKPKIFSKEWIDKWQLVFYRKLCDHHTDLLKVFHNLLIIIMLFSIFSFVLDKFKQPSIENNAKYHIVQVDTNESYIFKEHNKTTYNIFGLNINKESGKLDEFVKNNFVYVLILLFIVLSILSFNIFTNLYIFGSFFYVIFNFLDLVALYTHIAIISLFVFFALKFILLDDKQEIIRKIIIGVSYIVCIFALLAKPSLMLPVFGSFLEKDTNATYPLLLSLSVVYFILVALVIFSLQKTARKNSIVPS
ncbi:pentapeptide repeat-containing protein [Campylobacter sp. IFREMER_LSEM_CL292]|uniref:pentapeptide repeat-containing protein n=1 Tax=Campylobacter sp. IFREMER_LSEM_CL292 TaxID=2911623 RepID=UPI003992FB9F